MSSLEGTIHIEKSNCVRRLLLLLVVGSAFEHYWGNMEYFRILLTTCGVNFLGDNGQYVHTL